MQGSQLAQNFLNQMMQNFMTSQQNTIPQYIEADSANQTSPEIPFSGPSEGEMQEAYDSGAFGSLAGRDNYDQTVLSRMGASHNAGVGAQESLKKNRQLQEINREELKQKMMNTIMTVERYKEEHALKSRELDMLDRSRDQDFMLKSQGLNEDIRHHGEMENLKRAEMSAIQPKPNSFEKHDINALLGDYSKAKSEQSILDRIKNPKLHIKDKEALARQLPSGQKYIQENMLWTNKINQPEVKQLEETNQWKIARGYVFSKLIDQGNSEKSAYQRTEQIINEARKISNPKERKNFIYSELESTK